MREILFRGQTRRKGEKVRIDGTPVESNWVYGGIFPNNNDGDFAIIYQQEPEIEKFPVYSDTVGQYAGLPDKNRKKIFDGDIVNIWGMEPGINGLYKVIYCEKNHTWALERLNNERYLYFTFSDLNGFNETCEVVGNIFDNPELFAED